jgi:hypothetical protein
MKKKWIFYPLFYILLVILAIILPLLLWQLKKLDAAPFVNFTRFDGLPFELFGGIISFVLVLITWLEIKRKNKKSLTNILPIGLGLLVSLAFLFNIAESTFDWRFNSDYIAFEKGAKAILNGISPYIDIENAYVYPPLVGQVMALLYQIFIQIPFLHIENNEQGWEIIFYLFQCSQLLLIILAYFLTYSFARKIGLKSIPASLIVAALLLFNNSVVRTLNFHQTNLWILNCVLIGFLLQQTYPYISGLAIALGIHVKMYPFILILPWIALRKWKPLVGTAIGLLGIAIIQTNLGSDWTILKLFFGYLGDVSKPNPYRNNSINSIVSNFFKIPNVLFGTSFDLVPLVVNLITLAIFIWFSVRFIRRERVYRELTEFASSKTQHYWNDMFRLYGHSMDAISLGLFISPSVYEHHYIIAIPVALWAIATCKSDQIVPISVGVFLIFCIPTFDLFPFSFHRLVGLLMLVYFTSPELLRNYFFLKGRRGKLPMSFKSILENI